MHAKMRNGLDEKREQSFPGKELERACDWEEGRVTGGEICRATSGQTAGPVGHSGSWVSSRGGKFSSESVLKVTWFHPLGWENGEVSSSGRGWLQSSFSKSKELSRIRGLDRPFSSNVFFSLMSVEPRLQIAALPQHPMQLCSVSQPQFPVYPTGQMFSDSQKKQMRAPSGSSQTDSPWAPTLRQALCRALGTDG